MIRHLFALLISVLFFLPSHAQIDTSFWFVAPKTPTAIGSNSIVLQFGSYSQSVTVLVRQPANSAGVNLSFSLAANSSTIIDLTPFQTSVISTTFNIADNKGLYISSTDLVSVNYIMYSNTGQESISLKGTNAVGVDFFTPFPTNLNALIDSSFTNAVFDIVATGTGTTNLLITPRGTLSGLHNKNITFIKQITQGQTFSCKEIIRTRNPAAIVSADFDNDGDVDMAIVDQANSLLFVFTNNGLASFTEAGYYPLGVIPTKVVAADVNSDGDMDLIVSNSGSNNFSVFLGNTGAGNATFQTALNFSTPGSNPVSFACADINADNVLDVICVNYSSDNVSVFTGNNLGNFTFLSTYSISATASQPTDLVISDFDNDGLKDFAITNSFLNRISVYIGTSAGVFSTTPVSYTVGTYPTAIIAADFNADGFVDLAVANKNSNNISILKGDTHIVSTFTNHIFRNAVNFAAGTTPVSLVTTTVNVGSLLDIVVADYGSSNLGLLLGTSSGTAVTFGAVASKTVGTNPMGVAFADFNGDGKSDFVTANFNSGSYSKSVGTGTALATSTTVPYGTTLPSLLGGSIVSADQPVAVTISGAIQDSLVCPSFYTDQITNDNVIGKDYVVHQSNSSGDVAYVLAIVNSTSLSVTSNTSVSTLISAGETFTVNTSANPLTLISANQPIYVFNVAGNGCKIGGAQLAPAYCAGSYTTGFTRINSDPLYLQIYTRNGYQSTFTLDINGVSTAVPAANFTVVPGSSNNLAGARILYNTTTIPVGAYCVLRNSADIFGLSIQNGQYADGNQFSQLSNFSVNSFVIANPLGTATICSNTQFTLNGVVGGGPNTGVWTTSGFGTLSGGPTQLTNNIYVPNPVDTNIVPVRLVLTSTGICPNKSDTLKLTVKQGPIVTAGSTSVICSNNPTVQLNGNVYGATNQGVWSVAAPGTGTFSSATSFTPLYQLSNSDTNRVQLKFILTSTNNGQCNAVRDTVRITIDKAPIVTASPVNPLIRCSNNSTVFLSGTVSGTTTSTGKWSTGGTGIFIPNNLSLINNYLPSPADIAAGSVTLNLESTNNLMCKPVKDSVVVLFTQPAVPNAGSDVNSCKNNALAVLNAVITGTATSTGVWLGGGGTFVPSNTALTNTYYATPAEVATGSVLLTFSTTSNGLCLASTDQMKIIFQDKPTANFTVNTVCAGLPTVLTDKSLNTSGLGSLNSWFWDLGDGTTLTNTTNILYTYATPGTYTAELIVSNTFNCYDTIYKPVVIYALPTASMSISRACSGSAQLIGFQDQSSISPPDVLPSSGYYWDFGGNGFSLSKDTAIIFPSEGIYGVTHIVTSSNNCQSVVTKSVNITPKPKARFKIVNNSSLSLGATVSFLDSSNIVPSSWNWNLGDGDSSTVKDPTTTYTANGTYTISLTISDQFGCTDTYTSSITIKTIAGDIIELIPNIITPNGDGKNDVWRLDFIGVFFPTAEIEIYSRWGERIFKSTGYADAWNGSYKGDPLPVGAYYYIIKLNNKENHIYKGTITLIK